MQTAVALVIEWHLLSSSIGANLQSRSTIWCKHNMKQWSADRYFATFKITDQLIYVAYRMLWRGKTTIAGNTLQSTSSAFSAWFRQFYKIASKAWRIVSKIKSISLDQSPNDATEILTFASHDWGSRDQTHWHFNLFIYFTATGQSWKVICRYL